MNYLIFGLSKSGISALNLLKCKRHTFYLFDDNKNLTTLLAKQYENSPNIFVLKTLENEILSSVDMIILSPGISVFDKRIAPFKDKILPEVEVGFNHAFGKIVAVTGTNGKTTTTSLISHILSVAGKSNTACGNIGTPLSKVAKTRGTKIVEISSFQLESAKHFAPNIACLLNIAPDHIDRHKNMANYKSTKYSIFKNMKKNSVAIINSNLKPPINFAGKVFTFGKEGEYACYIKNGNYVFCKRKEEIVCPTDASCLRGSFNQENIMCAIIVSKLLGVKNKHISRALETFKPSMHRLQLVFETDKIKVYDDSKATNTHATINAVKGFNAQNLWLILGGSDKGLSFKTLFKAIPKEVTILACGEVKNKIFDDAKSVGRNVLVFENLKSATNFALSKMEQGVLLLSPACASFDEFENYKDRGEKFLSFVKDYYGAKLNKN